MEVSFVNSCELTASITAIANALACKLTEDELNLLGVTLTQLADTRHKEVFAVVKATKIKNTIGI